MEFQNGQQEVVFFNTPQGASYDTRSIYPLPDCHLAIHASDPPDLLSTQYGLVVDEASQTLDPISLPPDVFSAPLDVLQFVICGCAWCPCSSS
jgi:hypothetical protein